MAEIRRCGELLKQFDGRGNNQHTKDSDGTVITQREAAERAGISERQKVTAVRVANVPAETFERKVESPAPPTARNKIAVPYYRIAQTYALGDRVFCP